MYSFLNDYSEGCHPAILDALVSSNLFQEAGYGEDSICKEAIKIIKQKTSLPNADVHFISGATQANLTVVGAALKPYEAVIAASSGHIAVHEAGAIEATGHKVCTVKSANGKLTPEDIESMVAYHTDEHMVKPAMVYISDTTEVGTVYLKQELLDIASTCKKHNLLLFMDGARLAQALSSPYNDMSLKELSAIPDIFYLGGTKNGALLGEAIVINNEVLKTNFRYMLKQNGALLAKGRLLGVQFVKLFEGDLFLANGDHANRMALKLAAAIERAGYQFLCHPESNQIFPILPKDVICRLAKEFLFYNWAEYAKDKSVIRLVTSWATDEGQVDKFNSLL